MIDAPFGYLCRRALAALAVLFLVVGHPSLADARKGEAWIGGWASAQQIPEAHNALEADALDDVTLRQIIRVSAGGERIRVRISNALGNGPLVIGGGRVALAIDPASSAIDGPSDRPLLFSGRESVVVPAGAEYVSDAVDLPVTPFSDLAVSLHIVRAPQNQTSHPGSRATSYLMEGQHLSAPSMLSARPVNHWFFLSGVDVEEGVARGAVVFLGDSITDGYGVAPNTNARWTDHLAQRLQTNRSTRGLAVLNVGLGGNRVLLDGNGPNALARFERDVLARPGVKAVVLLIGVNDLGTLTREADVAPEAHAALVAGVTGAFAQMTARARERGIVMIGATILPFAGSAYYHPPAATEADRQAINAWIRARGNVDRIIDFDAMMRDPQAPQRLSAQFDADGLHPSLDGYRAMASMAPLSVFEGLR